MKDHSLLRFFSWNSEESKALESLLASLRKQLKECDNETPEEKLDELQKAIDEAQLKFDELRKIKFKVISVAAFKSLPHIELTELTDTQEFEQRKQVILTCTNVTEEKFNTLKSPDFIQLYSDICEFILTPSDQVKGHPLGGEDFCFDLLHPFTNEVEEHISHIKFTVPNVIHSQELAKIEDSQEREDFMFRVVTGLSKQDFEYLSLNDYLALKPQVGAFFLPSAGFFGQKTLSL
ncbi:phage tail assembly protein [Vibrio sp. TRT 17S01]|uniref:phage tail assembly protein n=1 Tax=Vibrio sp. TRT 17S01 TaxID=3418505 RepID=UPI003CEE6D43